MTFNSAGASDNTTVWVAMSVKKRDELYIMSLSQLQMCVKQHWLHISFS